MSTRRRKPRRGSVPEETLDFWLSRFGPKGYVREHRGIPGRQFRFDFAWVEPKIALEIQGGHYGRGAHNRPKGYERDLEKNRLAVLAGWRVVAFTGDDARNRPSKVADYMTRLLAGAN